MASLEAQAVHHRALRDKAIRELRELDPRTWTLRRLASELGVSHKLIDFIVSGRQTDSR